MESATFDNEESYSEISDNGDFMVCGPHHLNRVDWKCKDHCRAIAASLVNGVYVVEDDRRKSRKDEEALAPKWWNYFQFELIATHQDAKDGSTFAATFENMAYDPTQIHPRYVLAFRGTLFKCNTVIKDLFLDGRVLAHRTLTKDPRYGTALTVLEKLVSQSDPTRVWIAGHSLGAILALGLGKAMAATGRYIESFLFNPPFPSAPVERIKKPIHVARTLVKATMSVVVKDKSSLRQDIDSFLGLSPWTPHLFVHPKDLICCAYIGYFENRELMSKIGLGWINRVASSSSGVNLAAEAIGKVGEATHLLPSANLTKTVTIKGSNVSLGDAHGINQWWQQQLRCDSKLHQLDPTITPFIQRLRNHFCD